MYKIILIPEAKENERIMLESYITEFGEVPALKG
jgi:hypothetical protein